MRTTSLDSAFRLFACVAMLMGGAVGTWAAPGEPRLDLGDGGQREWVPSAPVTPRLGNLVVYSDRSTFEADFPGLPVEDFEAGAVASGDLEICAAPLDSSGDGVCFAPGSIEAGLTLEDTPGPDGDGLLLIGDGAFANTSKIVAANSLADTLDLLFPEPVEAVGLDVFNLPGPDDALTIEVYGPGGELLGSTSTPSSGVGVFFGVSSPEPMARLRLISTINEAEAVDDVSFGIVPFLVFESQSTLDVCASNPAQQNDIWEPNEVIELFVELRASGADFTGVQGTLTSNEAAVVVLDDQASWSDLVRGSSASNGSALRFVIDGEVCAETLELSLQVSSDQGSFVIPIRRNVGAEQAPDVPQAIPDGTLGGAESQLEINTSATVADLEIEVDVNHTWVGDLTLTLTSPGGTTVTLLDRPGVPTSKDGCDNNDLRVIFSDDAAVDPEDVCNPGSATPWITGPVLPAQALSAFDGESTAGIWTLRVRDSLAGDLGSLINWRLVNADPVGAECTSCAAQSDLALDKICVGLGDATCTLTVSNAGPSTALGVEVIDQLPIPIQWLSDDCAAGPPAGQTLTWTVGNLDAGESATCIVELTSPTNTSGEVTNTASVSSQVPDPLLANNTATAPISLGTVLDVPTLHAWGLGLLALGLLSLALAQLPKP